MSSLKHMSKNKCSMQAQFSVVLTTNAEMHTAILTMLSLSVL